MASPNEVNRPDLETLYGRLAKLTETPLDLAPLKAIAAASKEGSQRDFLGGLAMTTLGGKTMQRQGQSLIDHALVEGKPLRPNAADVAYTNPDTGDMVANPMTAQSQGIKSTEFQIKAVEAADAKANTLAEAQARRLDAQGKHEEAMALRREIAGGNLSMRQAELNRRIDADAARAEAAALKAGAMPAKVRATYAENSARIQILDAATAAIDKYPAAFDYGKTGWIPDEVLQRTDPKGVDARAMVFNIGSLMIHARSGAAVTAAEFPRLKSFIPHTGDGYDKIRKNLALFKAETVVINKALAAGYSMDQVRFGMDKRPGATPEGEAVDVGARAGASGGWTVINGVRIREKK